VNDRQDGFEVEKSEDSFVFSHLADVPANVTTHTDPIVAADRGRSLYYRIRDGGLKVDPAKHFNGAARDQPSTSWTRDG